MGGNTTFGRVVWAVGQISRSDLVQVGVDGKWECLGGVHSILERINCILLAYSVNFNSKSGRIYGYMGENTTFGSVVWVVGHTLRSDLVRLVFMASVSVY